MTSFIGLYNEEGFQDEALGKVLQDYMNGFEDYFSVLTKIDRSQKEAVNEFLDRASANQYDRLLRLEGSDIKVANRNSVMLQIGRIDILSNTIKNIPTDYFPEKAKAPSAISYFFTSKSVKNSLKKDLKLLQERSPFAPVVTENDEKIEFTDLGSGYNLTLLKDGDFVLVKPITSNHFFPLKAEDQDVVARMIYSAVRSEPKQRIGRKI